MLMQQFITKEFNYKVYVKGGRIIIAGDANYTNNIFFNSDTVARNIISCHTYTFSFFLFPPGITCRHFNVHLL